MTTKTTTPKQGRPGRPAGPVRPWRIDLRLTTDERDILDQLRGTEPRSVYLRNLLLDASMRRRGL